MAAVMAAVSRLKELHADEYDKLVRVERIARGLPEVPAPKPKGKLEKLREQLRAAGIDPAA